MADRDYSFSRALAYMANPSPSAFEAASVEIAASNALGDAYGGAVRGLMVPDHALTREQSTQTAAQGGALVGQAAKGFAGALRAALVVGRAGATILTGLRGDVSVPTMVSGAAAYWLEEALADDSDVTDSTPQVARGPVTPRTVAASIPVSRRLILQGQPDVTDVIRRDLMAALALEIDAAALGASEDGNAPDGLRQALAAGKTDFDASAPNWAEVLLMEQAVLDANAGDPAFILSPAMACALKEAETVTGTGRHIMAAGKIAGRPALVTSTWPAGELIAGGFSDLIVCMWGGINLRLDVGAGAASDTRILRAFVDVGLLTRRLTSFAYGAAP